MLTQPNRAYIQKIQTPLFEKTGLDVSVLRLDSVHAGISGNKWFKLKYNLMEAVSQGYRSVLTFGGAYSNHIHATAFAAQELSLRSIGVIRGEKAEPLNPTLSDAVDLGMKLRFISREAYRNKHDSAFIHSLEEEFGDFYLVPEGGTNSLALKGAMEIVDEIDQEFDEIILPVGTGGTMAGLICGLNGRGKLRGISVLKGGFLSQVVSNLVSDYSGGPFENWSVIDDFHFGGYARFNDNLISFINSFKREHGIPLDPIYTGKMMYGVFKLCENGFFKRGEKAIAIHTGGLQGIRGFNLRFGVRIV